MSKTDSPDNSPDNTPDNTKRRIKPLEPEVLYTRSDLSALDFTTTDDLQPFGTVIGQDRALEAMSFGVGIDQPGYNVFALGSSQTDKHTIVRHVVAERAKQQDPPDDWCYVNNFDQKNKPDYLRLPAGIGAKLQRDMETFVDDLPDALSASFESEEYQTQRQALEQEAQQEQEQGLERLQDKAQERGVALVRTPQGITLAPMKDGEVLQPDEIQELSEDEQERLKEEVKNLEEELQNIMQKVPRQRRQLREKQRELDQEFARVVVDDLLGDIRERYTDIDDIGEFLDAVEADVVEHVRDLVGNGDQQEMQPQQQMLQQQQKQQRLSLYNVNVLVDHSGAEGAPVVYEDNPTYQNLIGRSEYRAQMGALLTDYSLIKPGAFHRANGGYLLLDARKVLMQPLVWEALKRTIRSGEIDIESPGESLGLISTVSLEPDPIPLNVKVVLLGERRLYYLLSQLDPDFSQLFKVEADFNDQMDRGGEMQQRYARMIGDMVREAGLEPFDQDAVARVIEQSAREIGDAEKLSARTRNTADLLREADYWSRENGNGTVTRDDVQKAIDAQIRRADRLRERSQERIIRDTIDIDTSGREVGQVNGLSVLKLGDFAFGRPTRITAQVRLGRGEIIDIERQSKLGGNIHTKGVMILTGFLGGRYATETPLSFAASLVFEQVYGGVDGDSASLTELCALLSAISEVPIKQSLALTGSVNQLGDVQAIGGVNEKIEGFFDICRERGLSGEQGVLIPASNRKNLMLRQDVIDAVKDGQFAVYTVETVDQAMALLTGETMGELGDEGNYPEGTINAKVQARLEKFANRRKAYTSSKSEDKDKKESPDV